MCSRRGRAARPRSPWGVVTLVAVAATACLGAPPGSSSGCDSSIENQVKETPAFRTCSSLTGLALGERLKKKDDRDPTRATFCRSAACLDVFRQLQAHDGLYCLAPYSTASYALYELAGGVACFGAAAFAPPTPPPTEAPTDAPPTEAPLPPVTEPVPPTPSVEIESASSTSFESSASGDAIAISSDDGSVATTPQVDAIVDEQKAPQSVATPTGASPHDATTSSIVLWLLVVTSSLMAVVFALACFVFYRRATQPATEPHEESAYVKQAKTTREQRTSSKTRALSTDCESPFAAEPPHHAVVTIPTTMTTDSIECDDESIQSCRIPYEKLVFGECISQGGFGEVYRGSYRGETVAIKTLLPVHRKNARQIQNFLQEVKLLAALDHERIVRFIGVAWDSLNELSVVMEFVERGDLRTLLKDYERTGCHPVGFDAVKVQIALHIAHGLMYLHTLQPVVLHRDLKSRNVLLDADLHAKITDFGVSRERGDATMTAGVGSGLWMAPEVMLGERYDEKADIFSFGVLLSEIDLHCLPYSHARTSQTDGRRLPDTTIVQMVSMGLLSVAFSEGNSNDSVVAQLGRDCVSLDPAARPRASDVLHRLHQIRHSFGSLSHSEQLVPGAFV